MFMIQIKIYACENLVLKIYRKPIPKSSYSRSDPKHICRNSHKDPDGTWLELIRTFMIQNLNTQNLNACVE